MSKNSFVTILIEALNKKAALLANILELCSVQEICLKQEKPNLAKYTECTEKKTQLSKEIEKIDEGFIAVYDRIKGELEENVTQYADEIRNMQAQVKIITERSNAINVKEHRLNEDLKRKVGNDVAANSVSKAQNGIGTAAQKYAQTMKGVAKTDSGATFINRKQ